MAAAARRANTRIAVFMEHLPQLVGGASAEPRSDPTLRAGCCFAVDQLFLLSFFFFSGLGWSGWLHSPGQLCPAPQVQLLACSCWFFWQSQAKAVLPMRRPRARIIVFIQEL